MKLSKDIFSQNEVVLQQPLTLGESSVEEHVDDLNIGENSMIMLLVLRRFFLV